MAQLSDLHVGSRVDDAYLRSVFDRVRALTPEVVVYTGDFVSYDTNIAKHAGRVFPYLPVGSRATFGIFGNHDYGPGWTHPDFADDLAAIVQSVGVRVLRNEVGVMDGLQIIGMDDLWAGRFDPTAAWAKMDTSLPAIVLSHNPDTADEPGWDNYTGWILSGHTHGGQCKAPFLPPPLLPVKNRRYVAGEYELTGNRRLYINRGVGHLLRVRINARPEVTLFTLTRA